MNDFEINRPEGYKRALQAAIDADYSTQSWKRGLFKGAADLIIVAVCHSEVHRR